MTVQTNYIPLLMTTTLTTCAERLISSLIRHKFYHFSIYKAVLVFLAGHEFVIWRAKENILAPVDEDRRHGEFCPVIEINLFHFVRVWQQFQDLASQRQFVT